MLTWFKENFAHYYSKMQECNYFHPCGEPNQHHLEGNVWSHVELDVVLWALILHDIGKIYTRTQNNETNKVMFYNFEGVSCFTALEVLNKTTLSENEKCLVLKLIAFQYTIIDYIKYNNPTKKDLLQLFEYDEITLKYLAEYVECDLFGRVIDDRVREYYDLNKIKKFQRFTEKLEPTRKLQVKKNNDLYILIGPPCSRKSTWMKNMGKHFLVVNRDTSMEFIGRKYGKHTFNEACELADTDKKIAKEINLHYHNLTQVVKKSKNMNIIIDNPNMKLKHRKEWIDIFKESHNIHVIFFLSSFENLKKCDRARYMSIGKMIGENAILEKLIDFIYPLYSEGIDDFKYIFH